MTSNEAVIRAAIPRNGPKLLSRIMAVPVETARHWYYKHLSAARTRELALALLAEMDAQDRERAATRARLRVMAGHHESTGGVVAGANSASNRDAQDSAPACPVCGDRGPELATPPAIRERG